MEGIDLPDYLRDGFDVSTYTVRDLIIALSAHGVGLPTSKAKRDTYVNLFKENILDKRDRLLAEHIRNKKIKPKSPPGTPRNEPPPQPVVVPVEPSSPPVGIHFDPGVPAFPIGDATTPGVRRRRTLGTEDLENIPMSKTSTPHIKREPPSGFTNENPFQSPTSAGETPRKQAEAAARLRKSGKRKDDGDVPPPEPIMFKWSTPMRQEAQARIKVEERAVEDRASVFSPPSMREESENFGRLRKAVATPARIRDGLKSAAAQSQRDSVPPSVQVKEEFVEPAPATAVRLRRRKSVSGLKEEASKHAEEFAAKLENQTVPLKPRKKRQKTGESTERSNPVGAESKKSTRKKGERRKSSSSGSFIAPTLFIIAASAFLAVYSWYNTVYEVLSFCDRSGRPSIDFDLESHQHFLSPLMPQCIKCPDHAVCVDKLVMSCDHPDYILQASPLSQALPFLPFPFNAPVCVPDEQKRKAEDMRKRQEDRKLAEVDRIILVVDGHVRRWVGKLECGTLDLTKESAAAGMDLGFVWTRRGPRRVLGMPMRVAKHQIQAAWSKNHHDSLEQFEELWQMLVRRLATQLPGDRKDVDVYTVLDDSGQHRLFVSRNPPERPLSCQVTRSIGGFFAGYAVEIGLTVLVTVGCMVYWRRHVSQTRENGIVYQLVEDLLDSIHEEAENHRRDPVRHPVPGLSVAQLRDHYLPPAALAANSKPTPENADLVRHGWVPMVDANGRTRWYASDARTRVRVWGKAQGYVLRNSNIRETVMEFRGEQHRVWEWIGSYALKPRGGRKVEEEGVGRKRRGAPGDESFRCEEDEEEDGEEEEGQQEESEGAKVGEEGAARYPSLE